MKRSFVDLKIGPPPKEKWAEFWGQVSKFFVEVLKVYGEVSNRF